MQKFWNFANSGFAEWCTNLFEEEFSTQIWQQGRLCLSSAYLLKQSKFLCRVSHRSWKTLQNWPLVEKSASIESRLGVGKVRKPHHLKGHDGGTPRTPISVVSRRFRASWTSHGAQLFSYPRKVKLMGSLDVSPQLAPRLAGAVAESVSEDRFCIKHAVFVEKIRFTFLKVRVHNS